MRIWLPDAFAPSPKPMVADVPLVQVMITEPVPSSFALAFVTIGSYAGKATGAVDIVQFAPTVAVTLRFAVALPARTGLSELATRTPMVGRTKSSLLNLISLFLSCSLSSEALPVSKN
jgi:hypothetical protein